MQSSSSGATRAILVLICSAWRGFTTQATRRARPVRALGVDRGKATFGTLRDETAQECKTLTRLTPVHLERNNRTMLFSACEEWNIEQPRTRRYEFKTGKDSSNSVHLGERMRA
eukprot:1187602-Prorocentrum_minimum.AAC.2